MSIIFGFDIDCVLTNEDDGKENRWLKAASIYFDLPIVENVYSLQEAFKVTREQVDDFVATQAEAVLEAMPPRPLCREVLHELIAQGHLIYLITARRAQFRPVTLRWLAAHEIPYHRLYMREDITRPFSKGELCQRLGVEFFVDDHYENCVDLKAHNIYTLMFHASHNVDKQESMTVVYSWEDIRMHAQQFLDMHPRVNVKRLG
ncbi:MAG: 5' nucleotidase, NT5C type [Limnochordia bacterium]|jgi:uncharacterized HAD superfamily protein